MTTQENAIRDLLAEHALDRLQAAVGPIRSDLHDAVDEALRGAVERLFRPGHTSGCESAERNGQTHEVHGNQQNPGD